MRIGTSGRQVFVVSTMFRDGVGDERCGCRSGVAANMRKSEKWSTCVAMCGQSLHEATYCELCELASRYARSIVTSLQVYSCQRSEEFAGTEFGCCRWYSRLAVAPARLRRAQPPHRAVRLRAVRLRAVRLRAVRARAHRIRPAHL